MSKSRLEYRLFAAVLLLVGASASWGAAAAAPRGGTAVVGLIPDRTIRITDQTRYVNVMRYETIRFVISGAKGQESSFDWRADQYDSRVFPLAEIAPGDVLGNRSVQVYIQRDPPTD